MADRETELAQHLLDGVESLRAGRVQHAVHALQTVCDDPELSASDDLLDIRARAHSLLAQALLEADRPDEAQAPLAEAQRIVQALGDQAALPALAELSGRVRAARSAQAHQAEHEGRAARLAALSVEEIEARTRSAEARVDVLVRKANAEADLGRHHEALQAAERALVGAMTLGDPRLEVLSRLSICRADPARAEVEILRALACADRANETGLITAVAKAAELHGVSLPTEPGGGV